MCSRFVLSQLCLWPYLPKYVQFTKPEWKNVRIHIKPNLTLFLTVIAVSLFKIMDKIMLGIMTSKEQVGFYESSEKIIQIPMSLIVSLGTVMLPRISNLVANNHKKNTDMLQKSVIYAMFLSTICFVVAICWSIYFTTTAITSSSVAQT